MPTAPLLVRARYPDLIRNTPGLVAYWRMRDVAGAVARNELTTVGATMTNTPTPYQGAPVADGAGIKFNGTNQAMSAAINLSPFAQMSLSFWLWWDAFANNDKFLGEYSANSNLDDAFFIDPNGSGGAFYLNMHRHTTSDINWGDTFPRPSAAAWHHYLITLNRATPGWAAYVDGVVQTLTNVGHTAGAYGNFANSSLYLMSRGASSLFGAGRLSEVALFGGVLLNANDARSQYQAGVGW